MIAAPVPVLPYLGDARTLSFPEVSACLLLGWGIVLLLPHVHQLSERARTLGADLRFRVQRAGDVLRPARRAVSVLPVLMQSERGSRDGLGKATPLEGTGHPLLGGGVRARHGSPAARTPPPNPLPQGEGVSSSCAIPSPASVPAASRPTIPPHPARLRGLAPALHRRLCRDPRPPAVLRLPPPRDRRPAGARRGDRGPKLVILAGSNGPYSHRCATIGPLLRMPCVNGGVAVGIGLDYLFARWQPLLHPGDIVYLPMEEVAVRPHRAATALGPDAAIMLRHDPPTLAALPPQRWLGALFVLRFARRADGDDRDRAGRRRLPRSARRRDRREQCHGATMSATPRRWPQASVAVLDAIEPYHPTAAQIRAGYGSVLIGRFALLVARAWRAGDRRPADRLRQLADTGCQPRRDPRDLHGPRRPVPGTAEPQPLSARRLLRYRRPPQRDLAGGALHGRGRRPCTVVGMWGGVTRTSRRIIQTWPWADSGRRCASPPYGGYGAPTGNDPVMLQDFHASLRSGWRAASTAVPASLPQPTLHTSVLPVFHAGDGDLRRLVGVAARGVVGRIGQVRLGLEAAAHVREHAIRGLSAWSRHRLNAGLADGGGTMPGQGSDAYRPVTASDCME